LPVSPARLAAFRILLRVQREESYASELLHSSLTDSLQENDLRLATELVFGTLRQQRLLDYLLAACSTKALSKLDTEVLAPAAHISLFRSGCGRGRSRIGGIAVRPAALPQASSTPIKSG
jgi:hypothetical protein